MKAAPSGRLRIFAKPEPDEFYVLGCDVGSGRLAPGEGREEKRGDPSCGQVIRYSNYEQVAEWHGLIEPDEFAWEMAGLGYFYNTAFLACEANGEGWGAVRELQRRVCYPYLFHRERESATQRVSYEYPGWYTSNKNKIPGVGLLVRLIEGRDEDGESEPVLVHSPELIDEAMSFIHSPTDKGVARYRADEGSKDDRVMAWLIACAARNSPQCAPPSANDAEGVLRVRMRAAIAGLGIRSDGERMVRPADIGKKGYEEWIHS